MNMNMELDERYLSALRRALEEERKHEGDQKYLGWAWYEVQAAPALLNRLVVEGLVTINFKSNSSTYYLLTEEGRRVAMGEGADDVGGEEQEEAGEIPEGLFDAIELHEDKKRILMMGLRAEKPVHFLLIGSVASAKSMFLSQLATLPRAVYTLGSSLTKAGIIELLFEKRPRYLIIDELDKVDDQDNITALLSLMEGGVVVETKHNRHREERFDTRVFAGANYVERIAPELMSRFYTLRFREYTPDEYVRVATAVLTKREGVPPELAEHVVMRLLRDVGTRDVRDAVKVARLANGDRAVADSILNYMAAQRHGTHDLM